MPTISSAQRRVLAALLRAQGDVNVASRIAKVTKQYIYDVVRRLRSSGVKFYAEPVYRALGLTPVLVVNEGDGTEEAWSRNVIFSARYYGFNGRSYKLEVFVVSEDKIDSVFRELSGKCLALTELYDILQPVPEIGLEEFLNKAASGKFEKFQLRTIKRVSVDRYDAILMSKLGEDYFTPLKTIAEEKGVNRSTLSYHYRRHVKSVIRLRYHYIPSTKLPPLLLKVNLASRDALSLLTRCSFVLEVFLGRDKSDALLITTLKAEQLWSLVRKTPSLQGTFGEINVSGMIDPSTIKRGVPDYESLFASTAYGRL